MEKLWYAGANPTADLCVFAHDRELGPVVLSVVRTGGAEEGRLALPGGFVDTRVPKGGTWDDSLAENPRDSAVREALEETGVAISADRVVPVGVYEGGGRDPRDGADAWTRSHAYAVVLTDEEYREAKGRLSESSETRQVGFRGVGELLDSGAAFDHSRILGDAMVAAGMERPRKRLGAFADFAMIYAGAFAGFGLASGLASRMAAGDGAVVAAGFAAAFAGGMATRALGDRIAARGVASLFRAAAETAGRVAGRVVPSGGRGPGGPG